jgi:molybdopterin biosynthesis enzyme MoaB
MSEFVTKEEFEKTIHGFKTAFEILNVQTNAALSIATTAFSESKDLDASIKLLEKMFESSLNTLHFSPVTDDQIEQHRSIYSKYITTLKDTLKKHKKDV